MPHRRYACLLAVIASSAMILSAACTRSTPELATPEQVSAPAGVTYLSVSERERVQIRVQPNRSVTWIRERGSAASGMSTSVELRWTAKTPVVSAISDVMYQLTRQPLGAIGMRDERERWRALRVSSGGTVPTLHPASKRAWMFATLEETLFRALSLSDRKYLVPLPIDESADAVARCHQADRRSFQVVAAADADSLDYHESIDDESGKGCVSEALSSLRQAMHQGGSGRHAEGVMRHGGRIEVRRGKPSQIAAPDSWPEVPPSPTAEASEAQVLYRIEAPFSRPRTSPFERFPPAAPKAGELVALKLRVSLSDDRPRGPRLDGWSVGSTISPNAGRSGAGRAWRVTIRSDQTAELAWQHWEGGRAFSAVEVAFDVRPDPAIIDSLFELARSLRLNERARWSCGETNVYVRTDAPDGGWGSSDGLPACARISGIVKQMQRELIPDLLGAQLEEAVTPMIVGTHDCRANGLTAVRAVLELASPTAPPSLEAADERATLPELDCARTAVGGFKVPPGVRELWSGGPLRAVVRAERWDFTPHHDELTEQEPPEEVTRASYRTHW